MTLREFFQAITINSPRQFVRAAIITLIVFSVSFIGSWLAQNYPAISEAYRITAVTVILFLLIFLVVKWQSERKEDRESLQTHRAEIVAMVGQIHTFLLHDRKQHDLEVQDLANRTAFVAAQLAERNNVEAQKRHEALPGKIAEAIEKRQAEKAEEHGGVNGTLDGTPHP
jgi:hypothetical protein